MGKKMDMSSFRSAYRRLDERYRKLCISRKHPGSNIVQVAIDAVDKRIRDNKPVTMTEAEATVVNDALSRLQDAIDVFDKSTA